MRIDPQDLALDEALADCAELEDLPLVKELIKKGIVKEAKHTPRFVSNI